MKVLLLKEDPQNAFYLSCENISSYLELSEIFKANPGRKVFFLDEITFVKEWWRAVKHKLDSDSKVQIFVTGSHAWDVRMGMDQMTGRWGAGGEFELLPMDFFEFLQMRQEAGWKNREPATEKEILDELELYFKIGGLPIALAESGPEGRRPQMALETYRRWILGDLLRLGKQESYLREPLLYWLAFDWASVEAPPNASEQLEELVAHEHLARRYKRFGYYVDRNGDVDFFLPKKWAIEVKWQTVDRAVSNLSKSYKNLLVPQKILWTKTNFLKEWP